ncbi:2OG-Fe(II) oxygenase family protein [Spirobacillus cienkowskii]|uniref:2OG-Fe(II) oxygenase family protein n=1 Tax=Spirobacillus cienkowskii TaxID=495820 RepID=UPI0030D01AE4
MLAFNHFRADKDTRGTKFHRDSGWVTVLRSTEPGLVALIDEQLYSINPKEDHFIINFGSSIEVLTQAMKTPVRANIHGVVQTVKKFQETNRTSYVVFLDSNLNGQIFRYESGNPITVQTVKEFAIQEVIRTYDDDETKL